MKTTLKPRPFYGISRIDQPEKSNHGWYLRLKHLRIEKFFADKVHGGKRKAQEEAQNYRDLLFPKLPAKAQLAASKPRPAKKKAKSK